MPQYRLKSIAKWLPNSNLDEFATNSDSLSANSKRVSAHWSIESCNYVTQVHSGVEVDTNVPLAADVGKVLIEYGWVCQVVCCLSFCSTIACFKFTVVFFDFVEEIVGVIASVH